MMPCFVNPKVNIPGIFEMHGFTLEGVLLYRPWFTHWCILVLDEGYDKPLIQASGTNNALFQVKLITEFFPETIPDQLKPVLNYAILDKTTWF